MRIDLEDCRRVCDRKVAGQIPFYIKILLVEVKHPHLPIPSFTPLWTLEQGPSPAPSGALYGGTLLSMGCGSSRVCGCIRRSIRHKTISKPLCELSCCSEPWRREQPKDEKKKKQRFIFGSDKLSFCWYLSWTETATSSPLVVQPFERCLSFFHEFQLYQSQQSVASRFQCEQRIVPVRPVTLV